MKKYFFFTLLVGCSLCFKAYPASESLSALDELIHTRYEYEGPRRAKIEESQQSFRTAVDDNAKYDALRNLYDAYRSYRIDSALIYADARLQIARKIGSPSKIASATINVAEAYAKSGSADRAISILDTLNPQSLKDYHLKYLNGVYRSAYELKAITSLLGADKLYAIEKGNDLREKAALQSSPESRGHYTLEAEKLAALGMYNEAVTIMEEASEKFDFSDDAAMQSMMGEIYLAAGMRDKAIEHLALSAQLDIMNGTKEYKSLILLAQILYEDGDVKRAFDYITCAFEDASFSKADLRTAEIMKSMPVIERAYRDAEHEVAVRTKIFLIAGCVLFALLLVSFFMVMSVYRQKHRMLKTIEKINLSLEEKNRLLVKADKLKLHNINILMMGYARHITRLRDFRKKIYRLIKTGQYDKAAEELKWDKADAQDIAVFQDIFDEAFLSMFPTFVSDVNALMKEPIVLKNTTKLTPELRIIAMMKLGMGSTERITSMFHYSAQTVYNIRTSIRNMLNVSWDEFETYLGHNENLLN